MPEWSAPDRSRSRAVLIGTSKYDELTPIPAAANSLDRMRRLLTGSLCAWPKERVTVLRNERVPGNLADRLVELYMAATDVALFYYVGHGQIDDDDRLCLGLVGSRLQAERRATTSLTFDSVRAALRRSRARVKIVILDCCFAGRALDGSHTLAGAADVTALAGGTGAYTLAATGDYTTAWCEDNRQTPTPQTYFTKYLVDIVERGIPGEPTGLTLDPIYWRLREELPAAGKPVPGRTSRDFDDTFVFARNVARPPEQAAVPDAGDRQEVAPDSPSTLPSREEGPLVLAAPVELVTAPAPEPSTPTVGPTPETGPPVPGPSGPLMAPPAPGRNGPVSAVEPSPAVSLVRWMLLPQRSSRSALAGVAALLILLIVTAAVTIATRVHNGSLALSSSDEVSRVAFSPNGSILASGTGAYLELWNPATGKPIGQPLTGHTDWVESVAFSPDGKILASGSMDKTVRLWDPAIGKPIGQPLTGHTDTVESVAFSPDGKILASGSIDKTVRLWDPATGKPIGQPLTGHTDGVLSVAFSPDGKILASGSTDKTVRLWDPATGKPIGQPLTGHAGGVLSVAFSRNGILASGDNEDTVRLWNPATGQPIGQPLTGHRGVLPVTSVAFSPDGKILASGSWDRTVRLWDPATGKPIGQPLTGHTDKVWSVAFSPDGRILASGSWDRTVRLWDPATGKPIGWSCIAGTGQLGHLICG